MGIVVVVARAGLAPSEQRLASVEDPRGAAEYVDRVEAAVADCGVDTRVWEVGGPARVLDGSEALF